jgi:hypothetical protein
MYWEPSQPKHLAFAANTAQMGDDSDVARRKAHRSWKCRWTGPHRITSHSAGKYDRRYLISHVTRGDITNVKSDRLYPYAPWSDAHLSTSPDLDEAYGRTRSHKKVGTWCPPNAFFVAPLKAPIPIWIGKILRADANGAIRYQWYEPSDVTDIKGAFLPCWWDGADSYRAAQPRMPGHLPFTGDNCGIALTRRDLTIHNFDLDNNYELPKQTIDACSLRTDIWWSQSTY